MVPSILYGSIVDNLVADLVGGAGVVPSNSVESDFVVVEPVSCHSVKKNEQVGSSTAMVPRRAKLLNPQVTGITQKRSLMNLFKK